MTMKKIAISVPERVLKKARGVSRRAKLSLSAYFARLADEDVQDSELQALLDEMLAETGGPLTARERSRADEILGIGKRRTAR